VEVLFSKFADQSLTDGSPGSGIDPASIPPAETFDTSGSHDACATVSDNAGNVSAPGCVTVQVDATPPSLEISCPAAVPVGTAGVTATITASHGYSGLRTNPSGTVPIETGKAGPQTITRTAVSNVGLEMTRSCTTEVGYTQVIAGHVKGTLVVKSGQAVQLTSTAKVAAVEVQAGGALDVQGASTKAISANGASLIRICRADVRAAVTILDSSGSVTIGEGTPECAASTFKRAVTLQGNSAGVSIEHNAFRGALAVTGGSGGTIVTNNVVSKSLTVTGNSGPVTDRPNEVKGASNLQ
jgi:hypothetical protein